MDKCDKIHEAQTQLNNREHYRPLEKPMTEETLQRAELTNLSRNSTKRNSFMT